MRVTQSQNVPLSCLSRPLADWLAEAAYRDILRLSYAHAFSAEWNTADREATNAVILHCGIYLFSKVSFIEVFYFAEVYGSIYLPVFAQENLKRTCMTFCK